MAKNVTQSYTSEQHDARRRAAQSRKKARSGNGNQDSGLGGHRANPHAAVHPNVRRDREQAAAKHAAKAAAEEKARKVTEFRCKQAELATQFVDYMNLERGTLQHRVALEVIVQYPFAISAPGTTLTWNAYQAAVRHLNLIEQLNERPVKDLNEEEYKAAKKLIDLRNGPIFWGKQVAEQALTWSYDQLKAAQATDNTTDKKEFVTV